MTCGRLRLKRQMKMYRIATLVLAITIIALSLALAFQLGTRARLRYEADRATCLETAMHHVRQGENVYCNEDNQMIEIIVMEDENDNQ